MESYKKLSATITFVLERIFGALAGALSPTGKA